MSDGYPDLGTFEHVRPPDDGAFDRIAELAQFLLDADAAIVDLNGPSAGAIRGASLAFGESEASSGAAGLADPLTALNKGFFAQASVPIRSGGARIGTLAALSRARREFGTRDVEILRRLAELVAESLTHRAT